MLKSLKKFDKWLDTHLILLLLLFLLLILRIPNFFEPYWYGDEAIYLTIANGLKQGKILYSQIIDHKTPLIYYFAAVGGQLEFRFLNLIWMTIATMAFFHLAKEFLNKTWTIILATLIFILLSSLPWLEGHIPNGELFVMGFVLLGAYFMSGTKIFNDFFKAENKTLKNIGIGNKEESLSLLLPGLFKRDHLLFLTTGFFFGLGVLTKVPAILDAVVFFSIFWFYVINSFSLKTKSLSTFNKYLKRSLVGIFCVLIGFLTPIFLSILYFALRGAAKDYLDFGLLYNFRYASSWQLDLASPVLEFFFSLPGKFLFAGVLISLFTLLKSHLRPVFQFVATWFVLSLFASLLSNRPYPHYFLQLVPALSLLIALFFDTCLDLKMVRKKFRPKFSIKKIRKLEMFFSVFLISISIAVALILNLGLYEASSYYSNFFKLVSGKISREDYYSSFNSLMTDNYEAARVIMSSGEREIFIWGTNPMLYALTKTSPAGRFTVSFHIRDFLAYSETLDSITAKRPFFIVVMKDENQKFPGFYEFLQENYMPNQSFDHFTLWKLL
ncbi:MAG: hypothetical protein ABFQ62_02915 [Patescibacteria group bacterium]